MNESLVDWLVSATKMSRESAEAQLTLARQLDRLAPTLKAVENGDIGFEHALAIAREMKDLPDSAQAELLEAAFHIDPDDLHEVGNLIRHRS